MLKKSFFLFGILFILACKNETSVTLEMAPEDGAFYQRAYPFFEVNTKLVAAEKAKYANVHTKRYKNDAAEWTNEGPTNIGGRVTDIARHPTDPDHYYIGTSVGGVWETTDDGENWKPIFDEVGIMSIGNLAISKSNPNILYVGTGEANASATSGAFFGNGVYKSIDGGATWESAGLENSQHIARLYVDPSNPDFVMAASTGKLYGKCNDRGLFRSVDGGTNWEQIHFVNDSTACIDFVVSPDDSNVIYSATWERIRYPWGRDYAGVSSAVWKSTDGGENWEKMSNGLPLNQGITGRIGLAISQINPEKVYTVFTENSITNRFQGIYMTQDGGEEWVEISGTINNVTNAPFSSFGWFFGNIRVNPEDDDEVFLLGLNSYYTKDQGSSWTQSFGMHVDMHAMEYFDGNPRNILIGNDGGLYKSVDGGLSFRFKSNIPITQFYNIEVDYLNPSKVLGGTQDNNTLMRTSNLENSYTPILGGDGFHTIVDPSNSDIIYAEYQWGNLSKSIDGGLNMFSVTEGIDKERTNWNTPVVLSPIDPSIVYYGSYKLYKSIQAENWEEISPDLTKGEHPSGSTSFGTITTIAASYQDLGTIYVGTDDGQLWLTRNDGLDWNSINAGIPDRYVTEVAVNPEDDAEAIVTLSGYRYVDYTPHVLLTTNHGRTWTDISANLPQVPVNDIEYHHINRDILFVGTDMGVWKSMDKGISWELFSNKMPATIVNDLKIHGPTNTLFAGTFGRSIYSIDITEEVTSTFELDDSNFLIYPNPILSGSKLNYTISEKLINGIIKIYSSSGALIKEGKSDQQLQNLQLETGIYWMRLEKNGLFVSQKLIVI